MANKSSFSSPEWELIAQSPYWVQAALNEAEGRMGLMEIRKEANALKDFLGSYNPVDPLVKQIMAESGEVPKLKGADSLEAVGGKLRDIANIVEKQSSASEYDGFTDFLMAVANVIAGATTEGLRAKEKISDAEAEAIDLIATSLKATDADKHARAKKEAAARQAEINKRKKEIADAKAKKEAEEKQKELQAKLAAAEKRAEEAKKREEERKVAAEKAAKARAERQKRLREERAKKAAEARAKKEAEMAKKSAEEAAAAKAAEAAAAAAAAKSYTVQAGDSLWAIAQEKLGNGNRYMEIFELNKDVLKDPGMIFPGQELKLP